MIFVLLGLALPIAAMAAAFKAAHLRQATHSRLLTLALATCVGIGGASALTFSRLMLGGRLDRTFVLLDATVWVTVGLVSTWLARTHLASPSAQPFPAASRVDWLLRGAFVLGTAMAVAVPVLEYLASPHGQWDAWAIWNQKARFMFRAGPQWTDSLQIGWSQPSHPPLVSASVARLWAYAGSEVTVAPALLAGTLASAMLAVVMSALDLRRSRAWVAGLLLVAPLTVTHLAAAQTADLPLSVFIVATLVMLPMRPATWRESTHVGATLWMAGATAGLAAWTKNEGVVFFAASTALVAWSVVRHGRVKHVAYWAVGAAPFLLALAWFKFGLVPERPDYLEGANSLATVLARVFDPARQRDLWMTVLTLAVRWGGPLATGALFVVTGVVVATALRPHGRIARGFLAVAGVMAAGYVTVYLLTPYPVAWLVQTTFDRLTAQVWPLLVFAACAPSDEGFDAT